MGKKRLNFELNILLKNILHNYESVDVDVGFFVVFKIFFKKGRIFFQRSN